jgi:two-component system CheB/CheR fusion protein
MAFDGLTALTLVRGFLPQIVLADLGLPDIDGYEVARRLRADLENAPLLVAVSGYGDAQARERSQAAGFAHHLIKPIDVKETIGLLSRLVDSPVGRRSN